MKKSVRIFLWMSLGMVFLGLVLVGIAFGTVGFRAGDLIKPLFSVAETRTYRPEGFFSAVEIKESSCDVSVLPSEDTQVSVVCDETATVTYSVTVTAGGVLKIESIDTRAWYEYLIPTFSKERHVTVYLPEDHICSLSVSTASGDVSVTGLSSLSGLRAQTSSGDVAVRQCTVLNGVEIHTASGDVDVKASAVGDLQTETTSGDGDFRDVTAARMNGSSTSGDLELTDLVCTGALELNTVSGDLELKNCDGASLSLKTASGDIEGTLRTGKTFQQKTVSGRIRVSSDSGSGICRIETVSGDATVRISGEK